jgi:hypothetical protein
LNDVFFDGVPATSVVRVNNTTITCVVPAGAAGAVTIGVNISNGLANGNLANGFTYQLPSTGGFNMPMMGI